MCCLFFLCVFCQQTKFGCKENDISAIVIKLPFQKKKVFYVLFFQPQTNYFAGFTRVKRQKPTVGADSEKGLWNYVEVFIDVFPMSLVVLNMSDFMRNSILIQNCKMQLCRWFFFVCVCI